MEVAGAREAFWCVHRQLRRRPGDLLSQRGGTSAGCDAAHDVEAEAGGERNQDAGLPFAGREV